MIQIIGHLAVACFAGSLVCAAVSDFRHYRIPNLTVIVVLLAWPVWVGSVEMRGGESFWWMAMIGALTMFGIGLGLYAAGKMGAGDVKLLSGVVLWAGPLHLLGYTIAAVICCIALWVYMALRLSWGTARQAQPDGGSAALVMSSVANMRHVPVRQIELPYGVAIAAGGLYVAAMLAGV